LNFYKKLLHSQNSQSAGNCNYILFSHFRNCDRCKRYKDCWAYNVWKIDNLYHKAYKSVGKIKERTNKEDIPTKVNWSSILMAIRNQADQEIEYYLRSVGAQNLD